MYVCVCVCLKREIPVLYSLMYDSLQSGWESLFF